MKSATTRASAAAAIANIIPGDSEKPASGLAGAIAAGNPESVYRAGAAPVEIAGVLLTVGLTVCGAELSRPTIFEPTTNDGVNAPRPEAVGGTLAAGEFAAA